MIQGKSRSNSRVVIPANPRRLLWRRLVLLLGIPFAIGLFICAAVGLAVLMSAAYPELQPRLLAAFLTETPTAAEVSPTAPPATTAAPEPTPTITSTPGASSTPSETPTEAPPQTPAILPTPDSPERELRVPILMYHYISEPPEDADIYRLDLSVAPENFRQQMAWLKENGYETISLTDLIFALNTGQPGLPPKPVILTFDDGYVDNYENAFPILQEFGFTGTFFILTDVTDRQQPGYMTWDMLQEMSRAGMNIEVHGREHLEMTNRDYDWLIFHLLGPVQTIEANLGYHPRWLSYPAGRYDADVIAVAQELGYWGAVTTSGGTLHTPDRPFELRRLRIRGGWSTGVFASVLLDS